ncbi:MAG: hypothetical protein ACTSRS_08730 [Candidatus Helarchaeota archaeon]
MVEIHTGYFLIGVLLFSVYRLAETTKALGGGDLPRKDVSFVFELILGGVWIFVIINQISYMASLPPALGLLAVQKILPLAIFILAVIIFGGKAFITPSKNFLISLVIAVVVIILVYFTLFSQTIMEGSDYALFFNGALCALYGVSGGLVAYALLWKLYPEGTHALWTAQKFWNIINNRKFLLLFIILCGIEAFLQLQMQSLLTIFL